MRLKLTIYIYKLLCKIASIYMKIGFVRIKLDLYYPNKLRKQLCGLFKSSSIKNKVLYNRNK